MGKTARGGLIGLSVAHLKVSQLHTQANGLSSLEFCVKVLRDALGLATRSVTKLCSSVSCRPTGVM
jgi:hypothetical protein